MKHFQERRQTTVSTSIQEEIKAKIFWKRSFARLAHKHKVRGNKLTLAKSTRKIYQNNASSLTEAQLANQVCNLSKDNASSLTEAQLANQVYNLSKDNASSLTET